MLAHHTAPRVKHAPAPARETIERHPLPPEKANVVHGILYSSAVLPYHNGLVEVTLVYQPNSATWFLGIPPQAHAVGPSVGYVSYLLKIGYFVDLVEKLRCSVFIFLCCRRIN